MPVRTLLVTIAVATLTLWPQGLVLCVGHDGHFEFEVEGAPCCPSDSDGCADCADKKAPDLASASGAITVEPPAPAPTDLLPPSQEAPLDRSGGASSPPQPRNAVDTVVLLV
ncbi:MAG: hypothetical protein ACYTDY_11695 [Planctomycetota bacterium]|jgi:hypothetical protein